jgi:hypothetical protein
VARELDRRILSFHRSKPTTTTTTARSSTTTTGQQPVEEAEETEEEQAARTFSSIFNSMTVRSGYWCFKVLVGFCVPLSKILFREMEAYRKKSADRRTSAIVVHICDSYISKWQYRLAMAGVVLYVGCIMGITVQQ